MGLMEGKKGLIFGVANEKSIAWAIAQALSKEGAELGFTYLGEALEKRVRPLAESVGSKLIVPCDVANDGQIRAVFQEAKKAWDGIDFFVHAVAFANKDELKGMYAHTSREGFHLALDISAYSLVAMTREAIPLMEGRAGTIMTLTYYGAEKVVPNYNVMGVAKAALESSVKYLSEDLGRLGIRINAISAGPIRTLASAGISGFRGMIHLVEEKAPLRRAVTAEDVAKSAIYLLSDLSAGVTGEIVHVDGGYNVLGM